MRIIAGRWRGRRIAAPPGRATRPTTDRIREAWMSAMQAQLPAARVVDLFAGSGALGLEALSRGAAHATFVERASAAIRTLKDNLGKLGARDDEYRIVRGDALAYAQSLPEFAFDVALADPPYGTNDAIALADTFTRTPFAAWLWLEHRAALDLLAVAESRTRRYGDVALTVIAGGQK